MIEQGSDEHPERIIATGISHSEQQVREPAPPSAKSARQTQKVRLWVSMMGRGALVVVRSPGVKLAFFHQFVSRDETCHRLAVVPALQCRDGKADYLRQRKDRSFCPQNHFRVLDDRLCQSSTGRITFAKTGNKFVSFSILVRVLAQNKLCRIGLEKYLDLVRTSLDAQAHLEILLGLSVVGSERVQRPLTGV